MQDNAYFESVVADVLSNVLVLEIDDLSLMSVLDLGDIGSRSFDSL